MLGRGELELDVRDLFDDSGCMSLPSFMSVFGFKLRESATPECGNLMASASVPRDRLRGAKFVEPLFENPR